MIRMGIHPLLILPYHILGHRMFIHLLTIHEAIRTCLKVHMVNTHAISSTTKVSTASIAEAVTACLHLLLRTVVANITLLNMHLSTLVVQAICRKVILCLHLTIPTISVA